MVEVVQANLLYGKNYIFELIKTTKEKKIKIYLITLDIEVGSDLLHFHLFLMLIVSF